jgi:hypothetical protein
MAWRGIAAIVGFVGSISVVGWMVRARAGGDSLAQQWPRLQRCALRWPGPCYLAEHAPTDS